MIYDNRVLLMCESNNWVNTRKILLLGKLTKQAIKLCTNKNKNSLQ